MQNSDVTIVVVPRERFSFAVTSLASIVAHTPKTTPIVYVDGRTPHAIRYELDRIAEQRPIIFVDSKKYLRPNAARNLGLALAKTKFVLFVDNDVTVTQGWLDHLVIAAHETGADIVSPLVLLDVGGRVKVHVAGGEVRLETANSQRTCFEKHYHLETEPADAKLLPRTETQFVEYHTLLIRMKLLEEIGLLDERMLSVHEHIDLILAALARGRTIIFEPKSVVTYVPAERLAWSDLRYFMLRWSEGWTDATLEHFQAKWNLDRKHPMNNEVRDFARFYRARGLGLISHHPPRKMFSRMKRSILTRTEIIMNRTFFPLLDRKSRC